MKHKWMFAAAAALLCSGTVFAAEKAKGRDPNRVICRTIEESGSRLKRVRACHTQAEWDELKRQMKQNIEKIQNSRPWNAG